MEFKANPNKIRKDLADASHQRTSFDPEKRAASEISGFVGEVQDVYERLKSHAKTEAQKEFLITEMERFQSGYAEKWNDKLAAHGRIVSSFIAGPSNFPGRQMEKRQGSLEKKMEDMYEWKDRAEKAILRELKKMATEEAGGEVEVLKKKLEQAEKLQGMMVEANKIIRKKAEAGVGGVSKHQQLVNLGFSDKQAAELLVEDFAGRKGFTYHLQNNNANIHRMKERVAELEKKEATPTADIKFEGGVIQDSKEYDRVRIFFDEKPKPEMISKLKGEGWHWSPAIHAWQRKRTDMALNSARRILGLEAQAPKFVLEKEQFYEQEYWHDPDVGRHPASGSGRLPTKEVPFFEARQVNKETKWYVYNPYTKEEFWYDNSEDAKKKYQGLYDEYVQITNELLAALKIIKDRFDNWYSHGDTLDSQYAPDMLGQAVASTSYGKDLKRLLDDLNKMGYKDLREWYLSVNPRAIGVVEKPEPGYQASSKKIEDYKGVKYTIDKDNYVWVQESPYPKLEKYYAYLSEFKKHVDTLEKRQQEQPKTDEERFKELKDKFTSYQFGIDSPEMKELTELERKLQMKGPAKTGSLPAKNIGRSPAKIDTTSKDYKSGYNTAISGRIYPPVLAWTDQGKAEFDAGYTEGKRVLYEQPKPDEQVLKAWQMNEEEKANIPATPSGKKLLDNLTPVTSEFIKWFRELHGGNFAGGKLSSYMDGEPYFLSPLGAEVSLRDYIKSQEPAKKKKEVLVFGQPEDTEKFIEEFGKPIHQIPEKPRVLGASSKQELTLKEARKKASEGKKLRGQVTLFGAVSTAKRLESFEEKPKRAEPLKFKRPIPVNVVGRLRTPPNPFIRPKPKLLFAMGEEQSDIDEERQALELARKMKAKFLEEKLKKQIKAEQE